MDTVDDICVSLDVDKPTLKRLINFNQRKNLKMFYVLE